MKRILFYQPAFLGDFILCIPTLLRLRIHHREDQLCLVVRKGVGEFARDLNLVNQVFELDKNDLSLLSVAPRNLKLVLPSTTSPSPKIQNTQSIEPGLNLVETDWDLALTPHRSLRTQLLFESLVSRTKVSFLSSAGVNVATLMRSILIRGRSTSEPKDLDRRQSSEFSWTRVAWVKEEPEFTRVLSLLNPVGISDDFETDFGNWLHEQSLKNEDRLESFLSRMGCKRNDFGSVQKKVVFLFVGSNWQAKAWPKPYFAKLCRLLLKSGHQPYLLGDDRDREAEEFILRECPETKSWIGKTSLYETFLALRCADLVVSNDSSGQHLAALSQRPCITLFGPTTSQLGFTSFSRLNTIVEEQGLLCRPCNPHGPRECPLGTHECMMKITPDLVFSKVASVLSS